MVFAHCGLIALISLCFVLRASAIARLSVLPPEPASKRPQAPGQTPSAGAQVNSDPVPALCPKPIDRPEPFCPTHARATRFGPAQPADRIPNGWHAGHR